MRRHFNVKIWTFEIHHEWFVFKINIVWDCEEILQFYIALIFADKFIRARYYFFGHFHLFHSFRPIPVKPIKILLYFLYKAAPDPFDTH
jgi:hypothetical protein